MRRRDKQVIRNDAKSCQQKTFFGPVLVQSLVRVATRNLAPHSQFGVYCMSVPCVCEVIHVTPTNDGPISRSSGHLDVNKNNVLGINGIPNIYSPCYLKYRFHTSFQSVVKKFKGEIQAYNDGERIDPPNFPVWTQIRAKMVRI